VLSLQRNIFCSKREEQGVKDHKVLELLYEEAKFNMLTSRYPCEVSDYIMLGGIQARLEIGPYDMAVHTAAFFRQNLSRFLPEHAVRRAGSLLSWLPWSAAAKSSPEARLIEQFKVRAPPLFLGGPLALTISLLRPYQATRPRSDLSRNTLSSAGASPTTAGNSSGWAAPLCTISLQLGLKSGADVVFSSVDFLELELAQYKFGGAVQCSAVQCSALQCSAVQYSAVHCSAVHCSERGIGSLELGSTWLYWQPLGRINTPTDLPPCSAFFRGQIETPAKSLTSLVINQDSEVLVAINSQGLHVIDPVNVVWPYLGSLH
jgi:hypothetical protein